MLQCARKLLDTADIVRDGDLTPITLPISRNPQAAISAIVRMRFAFIDAAVVCCTLCQHALAQSQSPAWLFVAQRRDWVHLCCSASWNIAGEEGDQDQDDCDPREGLRIVGADAEQETGDGAHQDKPSEHPDQHPDAGQSKSLRNPLRSAP
jgi:hypothetical protein